MAAALAHCGWSVRSASHPIVRINDPLASGDVIARYDLAGREHRTTGSAVSDKTVVVGVC